MTSSLRTTAPADAPAGAAARLAVFDGLVRGTPAPPWLHTAIEAALGAPGQVTTRLIVVSENASYLVSEGDRPVWVARVQQPGYHASDVDLASEAAWVHALASDTDLPIAAPYVAADGASVFPVGSDTGHDLRFMLYAFVPGSVLDDAADRPGHLAGIGSIAATLHAHARTWTPPTPFHRFAWDVPQLLGPDARWGDWRDAAMAPATRRRLAAVERQVLDRLAALDRDPRSWGLIHADLHLGNVITHDSTITVIDFDDAGYGWYLYDFGSIFIFLDDLDRGPAMAREWLRGYAAVAGHLPDADLETACDFAMVRWLMNLGWAVSHRPEAYPDGFETTTQVVESTLELADRYVADRTWLLG